MSMNEGQPPYQIYPITLAYNNLYEKYLKLYDENEALKQRIKELEDAIPPR